MPLPEFEPEVIEKLVRMGPPPRIFDDAFTARVLKQMKAKGLLRTPTQTARTKSSRELLKYSVLVAVVKKHPKKKLPFSMEVTVITQKKIENDLLKEELLQLKGTTLEVSAKGKRYMADFEKSQKQKQ